MSLTSRMDNRTREQFEQQLLEGHHIEDLLAEAFRLQLEHSSGLPCTVEDTGVDGTGLIIEGNLPHSDVDKLFCWGEFQKKIEIKTAPTYLKDFFTFKVCSLRSCVEHNSTILLFPKSSPDTFYLMRPEKAAQMMEEQPHRIYRGFSPNDRAIRIKFFQYEEYLDGPKKWCTNSLRYILDHKDEILKDR